MEKGFCLGLSFLATIGMSSFAAQFDPPDLDLEYRLHNQFVTIDSLSQSPRMSGPRLNESYDVAKGDTLWTLSEMLYGDGFYWPRVWSHNQDISNPHLVREGHTLQFILGSEDDTPAFRFSEGEDPGLELAAATEGPSAVEIPPPEIEPRPVIRVPDSFPEWQSVFRKRDDRLVIDDKGLKAKTLAVSQKIPLDGYALDRPLESQGQTMEMAAETGLPANNQYLYVKLKPGAGQVGQKFLVVKDHGELKRLNVQVIDEKMPRAIQVFAEIELVELLPPSPRAEKGEPHQKFRAIVTNALSLLAPGHDLIPGQLEYVEMTPSSTPGQVNAQILGSTKHRTSALYGPGEILFVNKGARDGVAVQQMLDVVIDRSIRKAATSIQFGSSSSGVLKIVRVGETCSTGILIEAKDSVQQGDLLQAPRSASSESQPASPSPQGSPQEDEFSSDMDSI